MARFDFVTAGESHGPGLTAIVEGMPAGLELDREGLDLRHGAPPARPRSRRPDEDRDGHASRSAPASATAARSARPIAVLVANRDYANWEDRMNPWPVEAEIEQVHLPRPGHADLAGVQKYGHEDVRNVLERASARETAARVAAGALARQFLAALGVSIHSHVLSIAGGRGAGAATT